MYTDSSLQSTSTRRQLVSLTWCNLMTIDTPDQTLQDCNSEHCKQGQELGHIVLTEAVHCCWAGHHGLVRETL